MVRFAHCVRFFVAFCFVSEHYCAFFVALCCVLRIVECFMLRCVVFLRTVVSASLRSVVFYPLLFVWWAWSTNRFFTHFEICTYNLVIIRMPFD